MLRISPLLIPALLAGANYLPARDLAAIISSVLVHEAGHIAAIKLTGGRIASLYLSPFGAVIKCPPASYRLDLIRAAAGPAASVILSAAAALFGSGAVSCVSLLLGALNLLPVRGLDGGVMLSALLSMKSGLPPPGPAERFINASALFALFFLSCYIFLISGENPTMLVFSLALIMRTEQ